MPSSRRKSVAFAEPNEVRVTRSRRSSGMAADPVPLDPKTKKGTKRMEADGGFKFKRSKQKKESPPSNSENEGLTKARMADQEHVPLRPVAVPEPEAVVCSEEVAVSAPSASVDEICGASTVEAIIPPSVPTLDGVPLDLLHAFLEECLERRSSCVSHGSVPEKMELAIQACINEVHRQGVSHVPPVQSQTSTLVARERVLERRLSELQLAKRSWDASASRCTSTAETSAIRKDIQADASVISAMPGIPDIESQLKELQFLADLCADQVIGTMRHAENIVKRGKLEQHRLAQAAHKAAFKDYADMEQPQLLLRSITAK